MAKTVYWADSFADSIQRANLDGSGQVSVVVGLKVPRGIAVDHHGGKIYWGDKQDMSIQRANLDGTGKETLVNTALLSVEGISQYPPPLIETGWVYGLTVAPRNDSTKGSQQKL